MLNTAEVGKRIKTVRNSKQMTLRDVAAKAGVSATLISDIERGKTSPTVNSLSKISAALDEAITHFIQENWETEVTHTARSRQTTMIDTDGGTKVTHLSNGFDGDRLEWTEAIYRPGYVSNHPLVHHGEKCVHVLAGALEVLIEGQSMRLESGDTLHFKSDHPHTVKNVHAGDTRVYWVTTPRPHSGQL